MSSVGQVAVSTALVFFSALNPKVMVLDDGLYFEWKIIIWMMALTLMILYECYWMKYFKSSKTMKDYYSSFMGFPLAGATLPVMAVFIIGDLFRECNCDLLSNYSWHWSYWNTLHA